MLCDVDNVGVVEWSGILIFSDRLTHSSILTHYCENPYSTIFFKNLNFEAQKISPRKNLGKTCWETAVIKRLAEANYRGVGFGFRLSNCTKIPVSYHLFPPPNSPLNLLDSSYKFTMIFPPTQNIIFTLSPYPLHPLIKIHKKLTKIS